MFFPLFSTIAWRGTTSAASLSRMRVARTRCPGFITASSVLARDSVIAKYWTGRSWMRGCARSSTCLTVASNSTSGRDSSATRALMPGVSPPPSTSST